MDAYTDDARDWQHANDRSEDTQGLTDEEIEEQRADMILSAQLDNDTKRPTQP